MTPQRFTQIVEAYGADARLWPQAERAEAEAFVAARPDAVRAALAAAGRLDAALNRYTVPEDPGLAARILAARPVLNGRRWAGGLAAGLAAACVAGMAFGVNLSRAVTVDAHAEAVMAAALDGGDMAILDEEQG